MEGCADILSLRLLVAAAGGDSSSQAGRDSPSVEKQKKRTPAWCDRILWLPDRQLYQLAYGRGEIAVRARGGAFQAESKQTVLWVACRLPGALLWNERKGRPIVKMDAIAASAQASKTIGHVQ